MIIDVNAHYGSDPSMPASYSKEQLTTLLRSAGIDRAIATELTREQADFPSGVRIYPTYEPVDLETVSEPMSGRIAQVYLRLQDPRVLPQAVSSAAAIEALKGVAEAHKNVRFVVSGATYAEVNANKDLFTRENVWMDISSVQHPTNSLGKLINAIGNEHILFGSNAPIYYPYANVFRVMNSKISDDDRERILWKNALALLGPEDCNGAS